MKAEQRKELETNTLADRMGHMVQRVKSGQRRTVMFWVVVAIAVLVGIFLTYRWWVTSKVENSELWVRLDDGAQNHMQFLAFKEKNTNPGKAAQLQIAWMAYWEFGIKKLGADPKAIENLEASAQLYREILKECEGDKIFEPQALLGIALVEEALAVQDLKNLARATESYEEVFKKYDSSPEGKFAKQRHEDLKDKKKRAEIEDFYRELPQNVLQARIQGMNRPGGGFPPIQPKRP